MAKQLKEMVEAEMKLLNDRVRHDLPLTEAEWAAWRQWMGLVPSGEEEEKEEEEASTSSWCVETTLWARGSALALRCLVRSVPFFCRQA